MARARPRCYALNGVDLDVAQGEFVAVMGPSGSGKSTVMNVLGCLDTPTGGEYVFRGIHVERLSRDQRARLRRKYIGFVFQGFNLLARTSAQENVELPLLYRGESAATRHRLARETLAAVGLAGWEHHTPGGIVGGTAAAGGHRPGHRHLARSAARRRADGNLDTARSREVMELLVQLNARSGITIIMVTHDANMAAYARRVIHFVDGRICGDERNPPRDAVAAAPAPVETA